MPYRAAAIPLAGSTALQGLRNKGKVKQGDRVLINGASGGVGAFAVQIAKAYGADVTGVASGEQRDFVLQLGADDFIDYQLQDFAESDRKWDLVLDAAGKRKFREVRPVLNQPMPSSSRTCGWRSPDRIARRAAK